MAVSLIHGFLGREFDGRSNLEDFARFLSDRYKRDIKSLHLLHQVHGDLICEPEPRSSVSPDRQDGDGWFLSPEFLESIEEPQVHCILTADCFPVVIRTRVAPFAGSILHCGWRSAVLGILLKSIQHFQQLGFRSQDLEVFIGPGAQSCCYEVSENFSKEAAQLYPGTKLELELRDGRFFCDIGGLLRKQAESLGVLPGSITSNSECTMCSSGFFSFRKEKQQAGRQLSYLLSLPGL